MVRKRRRRVWQGGGWRGAWQVGILPRGIWPRPSRRKIRRRGTLRKLRQKNRQKTRRDRRRGTVLIALTAAVCASVFASALLFSAAAGGVFWEQGRYRAERETALTSFRAGPLAEDAASIELAGRVAEVAETQTGAKSGKKYWSWYGYEEPVDWCACFVSWCLDQAGLLETGAAPKFSYCQDGVGWFCERGLWLEAGKTPQAGMVVFFDWDKDGAADHAGIAADCGKEQISVIEGDSGNQCRKNVYPRDDQSIMGYGFFSEEQVI